MCCFSDRRVKADLLKRFGKRKTLVLWKVVLDDGWAVWQGLRYGPGCHVAKTRTGKTWTGGYRVDKPCGIHVFLTKDAARSGMNSKVHVLVPVVVREADLVRAGYGGSVSQAVFRKITIRKRDWRVVMGA